MEWSRIIVTALILWMQRLSMVKANCSVGPLTYSVEEESFQNTPVGNIAVQLNATFGPPYAKNFFTTSETETKFDIDYNTGVIKTKIKLDREDKDSYSFYIDKLVNSISVSICITVNVNDINDLSPVFSMRNRTLEIPEGAPHHKVSLVSAIDKDMGANSIQGFRLASGNVDYAFNVTGRYSVADNHKLLLDLGVNGTLDFETTPFYSLTIEVFDGGSPRRTSTMQVNIVILDTNDNNPIFNQSKYSAAVYENTTIGTSILEVHATDIDSGDNGKITYSIDKNTDPDNCFRVDVETGVVTLNKMLDYELKQSYKFYAVASDNGNQSISTQAVIEIDVVNINELPADISITYNNNPPRILENASIGYYVARVSVSDPESPELESTSIGVTLHGGDGKFALENTGIGTFTLVVAEKLDREMKSSYNLTLVALDSGSPPLSATKSFSLQLDDVNDNPPVFRETQYEATVDEMSEPGSSVLSVIADDPDIGENAKIVYSIKSNSGNSDWFEVHPESGLVTTQGQVDCEVDSHPSFWVVATDNGEPPMSSSVSLIVVVKDVNDKEPTFDTSLYTASVPENLTISSCILQVYAADPDCGVNGQIIYSLAGQVENFRVDNSTGWICITQELDHELYEIYEFSVIATDSGNFATTANVQISVQDINDNTPEFYPRNYSKNIQDSTQPQSEIISVHATDEDSGAFGQVTYSIVSGNDDNKFAIDPTSGKITVERSLPNGEHLYTLIIDAHDGGGVGASQRAEVYISVTGPGYNPPVFQQTMYRFFISENAPNDTKIGTVKATYAGSSNGISYMISSGDRKSFYRIEPGTGDIRTIKTLDHDEIPSFLLNIQADTGSTHLFGTTQVNITVADVNDNAPLFTSSVVTTSISEATTVTATIYSAHATDKDSRANGNGEVRYRLEQNPSYQFEIDATSGDIHLANGVELDYENTHQHTLVIVAYDQGQLQTLSSSMTLIVNVQDANDNTPVFTQGHFVTSLSENSPLSFKFEQITATDDDSNENGKISYSLMDSDGSDKFGIFPSDGWMYLRKSIDREERSEYVFTVVARDHGQPSRSDTAKVTVYVEDYNDNSPIFSQEQYNFYIEENLPLGTYVGTVAATDADSRNNALLQYDFNSSQSDFSISSQGVISTTRSLDREIILNHHYSLVVIVRDSGSPSVRQSKVPVHISVTDVNDHSPEIKNLPLTASVEENLSKGVRVVQIEAEDPDAGRNGTVTFSLALSSDAQYQDALDYFAIHPTSGWITTKEVLDYEVKNKYKFKVIAMDAGSPSLSTTREFEMSVSDDNRNDEGPIFPSNASIIFYVVENTPIGTLVGQVQAYDKDTGENGRLSYYIISGNIFGLFSVQLETGNIYTIRDIDYEETSFQTVGIKAIDNSVYNPKSSVITIKINIVDINDNAPIVDRDPVFLKLTENTRVTSVIYTFTATDADSGVNGTVMYEIRNQSGDNHLRIDPYSGKLSVARTIDYEQIKDISLIIEVRDQAPTPESQLKTHVTVVILIEDVNDNAPVFQSYQTIKVHEDEPVDYQLISIIATDADGNVNNSNNNVVTYTIKSGNHNDAFHIEQNTGVLTIASPLDREQIDTYSLRIGATDHGQRKLTSEMTLTIQVLDVNDNAPQFVQDVYEVDVRENSVASAYVAQVVATDVDAGNNSKLSYMIADGIADNFFTIDPVTGVVTLATNKLDRETKSSYTITAYVQDAGNPILFDMVTIHVNVLDVNDNPPEFKESPYFLQIPENMVQASIYTFVAHDADIGDNAKITYRIDGGNINEKFSVNSDSGVLSLTSALDRETVADYSLQITASDGLHQALCEMFIQVQDQNDNDPTFSESSYSALIFENVNYGTSVVTVIAQDADYGENGEVTYSLHNDSDDASLFAINATSGKITTKGTFDREKKAVYSFDVLATDGGTYDRRSEKVRVNVQILDINDNAPVFQEVPYRKNMSANTAGNIEVLTVVADDKDAGKNGIVTYKLQMDTQSQDYFTISSSSGVIKTLTILNSNAIGYHNLKVIATDGGDSAMSTTGVVEIIVGIVSTSLVFKNTNYSTSLSENAATNTKVIGVELEGNPQSVTFSFASGNHDNAYRIDGSGNIYVKTPSVIDYEENTHMRLIVAAMSGDRFAYTTVWVNLEDFNDNAPLFSQERYVTKYYEEQTENTYVMQVSATDADSDGPNSDIIYNIISGDPDDVFEIEPPYSGIIKTRVIIDYEVQSMYRLVIEAKDNGHDFSRSSTCVVKISIINQNDNPPKFPNTSPVEISEGTEIGTAITMVTANDVDKSPPVMYNFSSHGNPDGMFSLDRYSGIIRLAKQLNYEARKHYVIGLQASDGVHDVYTTQDVVVLDENDHAPQFAQQSYRVILEESSSHDTSVVRVNATDADDGENAQITYSLTPSPSSEKFYIHPQTGTIYTSGSIHYQQNQEIIQLVVIATDNGSQPLSAVAAVSIQITSINKHSPKFKESSYSTTINEDIDAGYVAIHHVEAVDLDRHGRNGEIDYYIVGGNIHNTFVIDQKNGSIIVNSPLDRESVEEYNLMVMAKDRGIPTKNDTVNVHIIVQDVNDESPYFEFSEYFVTLNESFPNDTGFLTIKTFDKDIGANAKIYHIITSGNEDGIFIVGGSTGKLYIMPNANLDYERQTYHKLIVKITDCLGCDSDSPQLMNITTVHVNVTDVNEYSPEFPTEVYFKGVPENLDTGSSVFEAHANDRDGGIFGVVEYSLTGTNMFSIHYKTGLVTNNVKFDYENESILEFSFKIHANDSGGRIATIPVYLGVVDVDEYVPHFVKDSYEFKIPGRAVKGTFIGRVSATDQDSGTAGKVVYRLKPNHNYFAVNASTGEIYVSNDLNKQIQVDEEGSRKKREINALLIEASSGMDDSQYASVIVDIDVDRTCGGCEMQYITQKPSTGTASSSIVIIIVVVVSVVAIILVVIIVFILYRRKYGRKTPPPSETPMYDANDEFDSLPQHTTKRGMNGYNHDIIRLDGNHVVNLTTSSDMSGRSGSSGRGSAEDDVDVDEELAMINSSSPSYLNNSNGFRKNMPDSGIQDDDNTSEPSVQNHQDYLARLGIDTSKIDSKAKSGLGHSVESMHQFSDSGGGEGTGLEIGNIDYTKLHGTQLDHTGLMDKNDMGFHEPEPNMGGSLSNVINSEEEYSGSYNWDYLLDWGPQYQPLAHVFSEIARLKDDSFQPKKQAVRIVPQQRQINMNVQPRMNPPPMITNAPPKVIANSQPVSRSNRSSHSSGVSNLNSARNSTINTSLPSMPRSPISHESSFTSPALTPSFTPSLSPLATRSPSVSPVNSGRGQVTPRNRAGNVQYGFSSSSSEQELRI